MRRLIIDAVIVLRSADPACSDGVWFGTRRHRGPRRSSRRAGETQAVEVVHVALGTQVPAGIAPVLPGQTNKQRNKPDGEGG